MCLIFLCPDLDPCLLSVKHLTLHAASQTVTLCYFNMVEPQMAPIWTSNASTVSSDQCFFFLLPRYNGLSVGLQPEKYYLSNPQYCFYTSIHHL